MYSVYEVSACTASLTTSSVILWFISIFKLQVGKGCFVESAWNINAAPVLHKHIRSAQYFRDICHGSECLVEDFKKFKRCHVKLNVRWCEMSVVVVYAEEWLFDPPSPLGRKKTKLWRFRASAGAFATETFTRQWVPERPRPRDRDPTELASGGVLKALKTQVKWWGWKRHSNIQHPYRTCGPHVQDRWSNERPLKR